MAIMHRTVVEISAAETAHSFFHSITPTQVEFLLALEGLEKYPQQWDDKCYLIAVGTPAGRREALAEMLETLVNKLREAK